MKIWNSITWDMETGAVLDEDCFEWCGPVEHCKGEGTAKDQLNRNNALVDQQIAYQNSIRDKLQGSLGKYLSGNVGFDPAQLAMMQSQFLDQNAQTGKEAGQNVMAALASRGAAGGGMPVGGDFVRDLSGLQGAIATNQSQGILGTNLANMRQALANQFNAANVFSGQSAQAGQDIGTFSNASNNALDQYMNASNSGFGASFMRSLGGSFGSAAGKMAMGGIAGGLDMIPGVGGVSDIFKTMSKPG